VKSLYESELAIRKVVENAKVPVKIPNPKKYAALFKQVQQVYEGGFLSDKASSASRLAAEFSKGSVSAKSLLEARRFIDKMRAAPSFRANPNLSVIQEGLKKASDDLRPLIAGLSPEARSVMQRYSFAIDALEALAREAMRRNNAQVIGLIDAAFLGSGVAAANPALGLATYAVNKTVKAPSVLTGAGAAIDKGLGATGQAAGRVLKGAAGSILRP
jgi:hypothetical protein